MTVTLAKPLAAVGFIGHSIFAEDGLTQPFYSVGLSFFDGQVLVLPPNSNPPFPVPQYVNSVTTSQIETQGGWPTGSWRDFGCRIRGSCVCGFRVTFAATNYASCQLKQLVSLP